MLTSSRRSIASAARRLASKPSSAGSGRLSSSTRTAPLLRYARPVTSMLPRQVTSACFSTYSSFAEPNPTLLGKETAEELAATAGDSEALLRQDIRVMGSLLGKIVKDHEGPDIFTKVEQMRAYAKTWRDEGAGREDASAAAAAETFAKLAAYVENFTDKEIYTVSRAFTHFLALANAAEGHHRARRLQATMGEKPSGALYPKADSCGGVLPDLLAAGHSVDEIYDALTTQTTELVFTAHPTEVNRRTILAKNRRIQQILNQADAYRKQNKTSGFVQKELDQALYGEIASIWLSDEVSRFKPTPETEAEKGTLVLETVLWETVPLFYRKLDATMQEFLDGRRLPLDSSPVKFASWMGGDRDGNPNVKPTTTRVVTLRNRGKAATLFSRDLVKLKGALSLTTCSLELRAAVDAGSREPYRDYIQGIVDKLDKTAEWVEQELEFAQSGVTNKKHHEAVSKTEIYLEREEFWNDLMLIHRSLSETSQEFIADGFLTDILRNVSSFGLTLIPLDVRQESDRHEEAIDCITRYLGLGSYAQWDEQTRINWLTSQISSKRPLLRPGVWNEEPDYFPETAVDTLEIFSMIADQSSESLGAYVISQATSASDVLAVLLLQLDAGVEDPLRVAPLFETLGDLEGAADTMRALYSQPAYMGAIKGKQEIMIGYSDSAKVRVYRAIFMKSYRLVCLRMFSLLLKDAGRLAASWAQYETQEKLAALSKEFGVDVTFFHGKGGTVGRGGNPQTFLAINAHAPETIRGQFRVTEQGEMISQNFGYGDRAERTLDIYTAAILSEKLTKRPTPSQAWRDMMQTLSDVSCAAYRKVVRGDERFVPYFRSATPELELSNLNIGSRPAKRKPGGGVESLRAIPWNFAWTQTRFNLPTWLGVGDAVNACLKDKTNEGVIRDMYNNWGSFRAMIDVVEMVLAKSEPSIAAHYDNVLVTDSKAKELGSEVRQSHLATEKAILDLTQHDGLASNNKILLRQLAVRNRYVDCLNVLQAETLKRIRKDENDQVLKDALLISITGVANGMGNTG
jgi:phosphoenolpyruvate carboxylase